MAELGPVPRAHPGAVVNKLLDEMVAALRHLKSGDANLDNLKKLLLRMEPFVRELDSFLENGSEEHPARTWLSHLQEELQKAHDLVHATRNISNGFFNRLRTSQKLVKVNECISSLVLEAALAQWASGLSTCGVVKDNLAHLRTDVASLRAKGEGQERLLVKIGQILTSQSSNFSKRDMLCTLTQLGTDFCNFGTLNDGSSSSSSPSDHEKPLWSRTSSEAQIYIENDVAHQVISHLICIDDACWRKWVGLWAMGGAGKTFAARKVCNNPRIQEIFTGGIYWVTVSKDQPPKELLLKQLFQQICPYDPFPNDVEEARCKVKTLLGSRGKVLLVLDDVWKPDILSYLDVISDGNILVTTRDQDNLRSVVNNGKVVQVPPLSEEHSWQLFSWHAFGAHQAVPSDIDSVARDVAKECKGLPLALEVLGAAMASKSLFDWEAAYLDKSLRREWQTALEKLRSASVFGDQYDTLYDRLQLSVDNLRNVDPRLPDCFFYFAAFPEDHDVDIEGLVNMWLAEGLVGSDSNSSVTRDVEAKILLGLLIAKSMIQLSEPGDSGLRKCKIHDVMRDVARLNLKNNFGTTPKWWKAGASADRCQKVEASEMQCLYEPGLDLSELPLEWSTRRTKLGAVRLSVHSNSLQQLPDVFNAPRLRVLMLAHNSHLQVLPPRFFRFFSHLRVLDLSYTGIVEVKGAVLQNLKSLVLLDLRGCFYLERISDKLDGLPNLETIFLCYCPNLRRVPLVKNLTKLETFSIDVPCQIPAAEWRSRMLFFKMRCLKRMLLGSRDVGLLGIGEPIDLRNIPFLAGSMGLEELWLRRLISLPPRMTELSHLKVLALCAFPVVDKLPAFDTLPFLERLVICDFPELSTLPESFGRDGAFPSIKAIHLHSLSKVDKLFTFHPGTMKVLETLELELLPLKELPKFLTVFSNVKRLLIKRNVSSTDPAGIRTENLESIFCEPNCFPNLESLEIDCVGELPASTFLPKLGSLVCDIPRDKCPPNILELEKEGKLKIVEKNLTGV